jgi:hypothetical protein
LLLATIALDRPNSSPVPVESDWGECEQRNNSAEVQPCRLALRPGVLDRSVPLAGRGPSNEQGPPMNPPLDPPAWWAEALITD